MKTHYRSHPTPIQSPQSPEQPGADRLVQDLTVGELQSLIRLTVEELLLEFLGDPDRGLTLRPEVESQLLQLQHRRREEKRGLSTQELMQELGLD